MNSKQDPQIEKRITLVLAQFLSSPEWQQLGIPKGPGSAIAKVFLEVCYRDLGIPPEKLDDHDLRQVLFQWMPPRLGNRQDGAGRAPQVVEAFLNWSQSFNLNPNAWKFGAAFEEAEKTFPKLLQDFGGKAVAETSEKPYTRPGTKVGRNDPCPCGSGQKYKKCCATLLDS